MNDMTQRQFPKITQEGLDDLSKRIGVKIENTVEPWCYEATRDNIRHYAHGIGDDNPLWCDPDYARGTKFGDVIALPSKGELTIRIFFRPDVSGKTVYHCHILDHEDRGMMGTVLAS